MKFRLYRSSMSVEICLTFFSPVLSSISSASTVPSARRSRSDMETTSLKTRLWPSREGADKENQGRDTPSLGPRGWCQAIDIILASGTSTKYLIRGNIDGFFFVITHMDQRAGLRLYRAARINAPFYARAKCAMRFCEGGHAAFLSLTRRRRSLVRVQARELQNRKVDKQGYHNLHGYDY